jgi:hypothetical protein
MGKIGSPPLFAAQCRTICIPAEDQVTEAARCVSKAEHGWSCGGSLDTSDEHFRAALPTSRVRRRECNVTQATLYARSHQSWRRASGGPLFVSLVERNRYTPLLPIWASMDLPFLEQVY